MNTDNSTEKEQNGSAETAKSSLFRWLKIAGFAVAVIIALLLLSVVVNPLRAGHPELVGERDTWFAAAVSDPGPVDMAVMGDSEALVLLSPAVFEEQTGMNTYIIGQAGQRMCECYYNLEEFTRVHTPKAVILETGVCVIDSTERREIREAFNAFCAWRFPVFRYHNSWKEMAGIKEPQPSAHYHGFVERPEVAPYTGGPYMAETDAAYPMLHTTKYYLDKAVRLCNEKEIPLILVSAISPTNCSYEKHNAIQAYADANGLSYVDLNLLTEELGIDWNADVLDGGDHLNYSGTLKMTAYLAEYLKDLL